MTGSKMNPERAKRILQQHVRKHFPNLREVGRINTGKHANRQAAERKYMEMATSYASMFGIESATKEHRLDVLRAVSHDGSVVGGAKQVASWHPSCLVGGHELHIFHRAFHGWYTGTVDRHSFVQGIRKSEATDDDYSWAEALHHHVAVFEEVLGEQWRHLRKSSQNVPKKDLCYFSWAAPDQLLQEMREINARVIDGKRQVNRHAAERIEINVTQRMDEQREAILREYKRAIRAYGFPNNLDNATAFAARSGAPDVIELAAWLVARAA